MYGYFIQTDDGVWFAGSQALNGWSEKVEDAYAFVNSEDATEVAQRLANANILPLNIWLDPGTPEGQIINHIEPELDEEGGI